MRKRPGLLIWITVTAAMVLFAIVAGMLISAMQARAVRPMMPLLALPTIVATTDFSVLTVVPAVAVVPPTVAASEPTVAPSLTPVPERVATDPPVPTVGLVPLVAATETALPAAAPAVAVAPNSVLEAQPTAAVAATAIPVPACSGLPVEQFGLIDTDGAYKGNALTDQNPDFRLSTLGYVEVSAPLTMVDYQGPADTDHPLRFSAMFNPGRVPAFVRAYQRRDWMWNEAGPPPYGAPGAPNSEWPVTVLALAASSGEGIYPAARNIGIGGDFVAMVLYADDTALTLAYFRQDSVSNGYVLYLTGLCVDPGLVSLYRAQLADGRRATGKLPGVRNGQRVGTAFGDSVRIAVRDRGAFLDPRSRGDWWQ